MSSNIIWSASSAPGGAAPCEVDFAAITSGQVSIIEPPHYVPGVVSDMLPLRLCVWAVFAVVLVGAIIPSPSQVHVTFGASAGDYVVSWLTFEDQV